MKNSLKIVLFALIFLIGASACHTYIFQPVKKQLVGKWLASDSDTAKKEVWEFKSDGTLTITVNDTIIPFKDPSTGDTLQYIQWSVKNKITKHFLYTDAFFNSPPEEAGKRRWIIIKLNKKFLYLESDLDKSIKGHPVRGSHQKGFSKQ